MTATPISPLVRKAADAMRDAEGVEGFPYFDDLYVRRAQVALDACHVEEMRVVLEIMHGGMICLHSIAPDDMKAKMQEYADVASVLLAKLDGKPTEQAV